MREYTRAYASISLWMKVLTNQQFSHVFLSRLANGKSLLVSSVNFLWCVFRDSHCVLFCELSSRRIQTAVSSLVQKSSTPYEVQAQIEFCCCMCVQRQKTTQKMLKNVLKFADQKQADFGVNCWPKTGFFCVLQLVDVKTALVLIVEGEYAGLETGAGVGDQKRMLCRND